jgi:hypothetical protein
MEVKATGALAQRGLYKDDVQAIEHGKTNDGVGLAGQLLHERARGRVHAQLRHQGIAQRDHPRPDLVLADLFGIVEVTELRQRRRYPRYRGSRYPGPVRQLGIAEKLVAGGKRSEDVEPPSCRSIELDALEGPRLAGRLPSLSCEPSACQRLLSWSALVLRLRYGATLRNKRR